MRVQTIGNTIYFSRQESIGDNYTVLDWPLKTSLIPSKYESALVTYTRASTKLFDDHEGVLTQAITSESAFTGARRVENLLSYSEDFSDEVWVKQNTATVTGTNTLNFPAINDAISQTVVTGVPQLNNTFTFSITMSGSGTIAILISRLTGDSSVTTKAITLSSTPTRYSISHTITGDNLGVYIRIVRLTGYTATTVTATQAQLENVTGQSNQNPGEYVSSDVLSSPFHGANVDSVKYFPYENGNTVDGNGVVTEEQGSAIAASTLKGISFTPELRTNLCENYNVIGADKDGPTLDSGNLVIGRVYEIVQQTGVDFTTAGAADNNVGTQFVATAALGLDADDRVLEIGGTDSDGNFESGLGTGAQNVVGATSAIPDITAVGDAAGIISISSDTTELASAGLDRINPSRKVYKVDNSAGAASFYALIAGDAGQTTATQIYSIYARTDGTGDLTDTSAVPATTFTNTSYERILLAHTPANAIFEVMVRAAAGSTVWFFLNQSETANTASPPIIVEGGSSARVADARKIVATDGTNFRDSQGMLFDTVTMQFDASDIPVNTTMNILIFGTAGKILQYHKTAGGQNQFRSNDGTNTVTVDIADFNSGDQFKVGVRWSGTTLQIGVDGVNGTAGTYDGSWNSDGFLYTGTTDVFTETFNEKDLSILNVDKGAAFLLSETT